MRKVFKKITSHSIAFVLGAIIFGGLGVYAATTLASSSVQYNNSTSGGSSTTVQGAIDELYNLSDIRKRSNIVSAYTYNASTCVTGEETTCVSTTCHKSTTAGSCKAGDIIKYKVNDTDIITFHVMFDNGATMTMQTQKPIVSNTPWIDGDDYNRANTDNTSCPSGNEACIDEGPLTALKALENATAGWTNVNDQTYTLGTTSFSGKGQYTYCSGTTCSSNVYTLPSRTAKARLITMQEAVYFGCGWCLQAANSCPKWMNTAGTIWTMNAISNQQAYFVSNGKCVIYYGNCYNTETGINAVVVVNK